MHFQQQSVSLVMYDTVRLKLEHPDAGRAVNSLTNAQEITNRSTGEVRYEGYLKNMWIKGHASRITLVGSLCKFKYGNNVSYLGPSATAAAITELGDLLQLPVCEAKVMEIHVAHNLSMEKAVSFYLPLLGSAGRYTHGGFGGKTVYYKKSAIELTFYDKTAEAIRHRRHGLDLDRSVNRLRYEMRLRRDLPQRFRRPSILASDLSTRAFFNECADLWEAEYFGIDKLPLPTAALSTDGVKELTMSLASLGLQQLGGPNKVFGILKGAMRGSNRNKHSSLRAKVREIGRFGNGDSDKGDLTSELDKKIKEAAISYRTMD